MTAIHPGTEPYSFAKIPKTKNGIVRDNYAAVMALLRSSSEWQGVVIFNEFSQRIVLNKPIPRRDGKRPDNFRPRWLTDADTAEALEWLQLGDYMPRLPIERVHMALDSFARECGSVHPVKDYLEGLVWDKVPRLDNMLHDLFGAERGTEEKDRYTQAVGRMTLVSAVARVMRPGCQADHVLVLEGPQGISKSTAFRTLAGDEWFSDSLPEPGTKDASDHLRGKWIVEMAELSQLKKGEIETIKSFITRREEVFRPAYGRNELNYPRQNIFVGTTNADSYLRDETGNRRFWPVKVTRIDLPKIMADRDQLWAEAVAAFNAGERWHLDHELEAIARQEQDARRLVDPWIERVLEIIKGAKFITMKQVLEHLGINVKDQKLEHSQRIGAILRKEGWMQSKSGGSRGWKRSSDDP